MPDRSPEAQVGRGVAGRFFGSWGEAGCGGALGGDPSRVCENVWGSPPGKAGELAMDIQGLGGTRVGERTCDSGYSFVSLAEMTPGWPEPTQVISPCRSRGCLRSFWKT